MVTAHFKNSSNDATKAEIAFHNLSVDLEYLKTPSTHIHHIQSTYERELPKTNPLLFAVASVKPPACLKTPIDFHRIAIHDAVRRDILLMLRVLHQELGGTPELQAQIDSLKTASSDELPQAARAVVTSLQRNVIASAQKNITTMYQQALNGLWSRNQTREHILAAHLHQAEQHLTEALALFDAGDSASAFKLYSHVMRANDVPIREFARAADTDFYLQFGAGIGIIAAAGAAFAYVGGGALYAFTGSATVTSTTGIGAYLGSLLAGGAAFTATEKLLRQQIFDIPVFQTNDPIENALEFSQATLKTAAMVGYLRGFGQVIPLPAYSGTGAKFINFGAGITHELTGLTTFTALTDGPAHAFAPDALAHSFATLLGLRLGTITIAKTETLAQTLNPFIPRPAFGYPLLMLVPPIRHASVTIPDAIRSARLRQGGSTAMAADSIQLVRQVMATKDTAKDQPVGFELEFDSGATPRDAVSNMMASALTAAGLDVTLQNGHPKYLFTSPQIRFGTIHYFDGTHQGVPVSVKSFRANGITQISVVKSADEAVTHTFTEASPNIAGLLDAPPTLNRMIIMAKDGLGDTIQFDVQLRGNTSAKIAPINAAHNPFTIEFASGANVAAEATSAITRFLAQGPPHKLNVVSGISVPGVGRFKMMDEEAPYYEMVSPKVTVGTASATEPIVRALQATQADGTRASKLIGIHVHGQVPIMRNGRLSIAPALALMRAYVQHQNAILDVFPSHPNRRAYIQAYPKDYVKKIIAPDYVTNAEDPVQIARVIKDYNNATLAKYSGNNMDNVFAVIADKLGLATELARTAPEKQTAELRIFDSIIDPESVTFITQFWGSFVHKYANTLP